ncbi:MAG: hypothetical protein ABIG44_18580 [Planctomycetota bacterium]
MRRSTRKYKKPRRTTRRGTRIPRMSAAAWRRLGLVVLWLATFAGIAYGLHYLEPTARYARNDGTWHVQWADIPPSLDDWIIKDIERETLATYFPDSSHPSLHDPDLCGHLAIALDSSPWIASIHRIYKQPNGTITIQANFRDYLTFVVRDRMGYLVDVNGVRLPRQEAAAYTEPYEMILITGVEASVPPLGEAWDSDAVVAGLQLVEYLTESAPEQLQRLFKSVDVSNYKNRLNPRDGWLQIQTVYPDRRILWGLPPGEEYDIECTATRKLELLWSHYVEYETLPDCARIDVRSADAILCR